MVSKLWPVFLVIVVLGLSGCADAPCPEGTPGCACLEEQACDPSFGPKVACVAGTCERLACTPGEAGCGCGPAGACAAGTECFAGTCAPPEGQVGRACFANRTCAPRGRCLGDVCQACEPGTEGCACLAGACTNGGSCQAGACSGPGGFSQPIPTQPACYTPCSADYPRPDGTLARCSLDGLLEGCVGDNVCDRGTCVPPSAPGTTGRGLEEGDGCTLDADCATNAAGDELICVNGRCSVLGGVASGSCASDAECPDFQVCIVGRCFANCSADSDCPSPARCHLRACRLPCLTSGAACPEDSQCDSSDGQSGYCMPTVSPGSVGQPPLSSGSFDVLSDASTPLPLSALSFSNVRTTATFLIVNNTSGRQTYTVRKVEHLEPSRTNGPPRVITEQPLSWLRVGPMGQPSAEEAVDFTIEPGESARVHLTAAGNPTLLRWDGRIQVEHPTLGNKPVTLAYRSSPEGRWSGTMYFYSSFSTTGLDAWRTLSRDARLMPANSTQVKNAFLQQWVGFLRGDNYNVDRLLAMIQSTQVESYEWPLMRRNCPEPNRRCYPFDNTQGYFEYTSNVTEFPIPRGLTELPFAIELAATATRAGAFRGRVVTDTALHFVGDPRVELDFTGDTASCTTNASGAVLCPIAKFVSQLSVGGRYTPAPSQTDCALVPGRSSYNMVSVPWLVPGFLQGTTEGTAGVPVKRECRDALLPFGAMRAEENQLLALSNPIPDGKTRRRTLELIDGAMVDSATMIILFRESLPSFLGTTDTNFSGLGFIVLRRSPTDQATPILPGNLQTDTRVQTTDVLTTQCSPELLNAALGTTVRPTDAGGLRRLAGYLLGNPPTDIPTRVLPFDNETAHYLCVDTGQFDGGPNRTPCPAESRVVYFTTRNSALLNVLSCNNSFTEQYETIVKADGTSVVSRVVITPGTCEAQLTQWQTLGQFSVRLDPVYRCTAHPQAGERVYCDDDRGDLRVGKVFYAVPAASTSNELMPLETAVDDAFRYKTRFVSRSGRNVGFAPAICASGTAYCYDPQAIEAVRDRLDCLVTTYVGNYATFAQMAIANSGDSTLLQSLRRVLRLAFSYRVYTDPNTGITETKDGFERLYAELLVMLGDDAYTNAFASRFDLAGSSVRSFPGRDFEGTEGINLSGGAGFELYTLYQAVQYYDLALERFYRLAPTIWSSISLPAGSGVITNESVTAYFSKVFRASTQKALALGEIARRYQGFNKTELARRVALRAYTTAYLEAIVASNVLGKLRAASAIQDAPEIERNLREAALRYRSVLLDMSDLYREISASSGASVFGFAPEYVPFPALDVNDINAFEKILLGARDKLASAAEKEEVALTSRRDFDTDQAAFQNELTQIGLTYEGQISDACGTFEGDDGQRYPAISRYAYLNERAKTLGEPCGLLGSGTVFEAIVGVGIAQLELEKAVQAQDNILGNIAIERARLVEQCAAIDFTASYVEGEQRRVLALEDGIRSAETIKEAAYGVLDVAGTLADLAKCGGTDCASAAISSTTYLVVAGVVAGIQVAGSIAIQVLEHDKADLEISLAKWETERECDYATIESNALVKSMWLELLVANIEILQAIENVKLAAAVVTRERNAAQRLIQEQQETQQLAINLEAARNDPNARIYKNDDILTADRTFRAALREAYKATKVYEYYTSQSYARRDELYLVRLVQHGDISLETYMAELEQAYLEFEEQFGNPDTRVVVLSLRDDVLRIPRVNSRTGAALREADRVALFRRALRDPRWLDARGYISFDFPVELAVLSPLTRNHKVYFTEAEWVGTDLGDAVGRVYLSSKGTGTVRSVGGDKVFYALPERTAVMNTFYNGYRDFFDNTRVSDIYANFRLRDLPVANSKWQVVLNMKDEVVNGDINLDSLSDVRIHIYYRDFTEL